MSTYLHVLRLWQCSSPLFAYLQCYDRDRKSAMASPIQVTRPCISQAWHASSIIHVSQTAERKSGWLAVSCV